MQGPSTVFFAAVASMLLSPALGHQEHHFYVSDAPGLNEPTRTGTMMPRGTAEDPFASIFQARDVLRRMDAALFKGPRYVHLPKGTHYLSETFTLTAADSGTEQSPIVYQSTGTSNQQTVYSGGQQLAATDFHDAVINGVAVKAINLFDRGINSSTIGHMANPYPGPSLGR